MKWLVILGLVAAVLAVGDVLARVYAEQQLAEGVRARVPGVGSVDADITSFPFLGRLLVSGEVAGATISLGDVTGHGPVDVAELRVEVDRLRFDRSTAFDSRRIEVTGIDRARIEILIDGAGLGPVASAALQLVEGAEITVQAGSLRLPGGLSLPAIGTDLLPCDATAAVRNGTIRLSCESDTLPAILVEAIGSIDLRQELGL